MWQIAPSFLFMNLMHLPLRLHAGRIVSLRLEQLPAALRTRTPCPSGSGDSGWRIRTEPCEHSHVFHHLNAAWQRLSSATHSPRMLADVMIILHAFPAGAARCAVPLPQRWCGRDLRPWLDDHEARHTLRQMLASHHRAALHLLSKEFPQAVEFAEAAVAATDSAQRWLPWLRNRRLPLSDALETAILALNDGFEADREALIAKMLNEGDPAWLLLLARQPSGSQLPFMRMLVETKLHLRPPHAGMHRLLETLRHITRPADYARPAKTCLLSLANGCTPRFVAHALRYHRQWKLEFQTQARPTHEPRRRELHLVLSCRARKGLRRPEQIWTQATGLKDWSSAIQRLLSRPREKGVLDGILDALRHLGRKRGKTAHQWTNWLERWDDMLRELEATPRGKCKLAIDFITSWRVYPEHAAMTAHSVSQLLLWLKRARDFEKHPGDDIPPIIEAIWARIDEEEEGMLLQVPEKAWRQMQPALVGWSSRSNAINGIYQMKNLPVGCLTGMLRAAPLEWARTMRRIGELEWRERGELCRAFCEHPLISCDIATTPLPHLIVLVDAIQSSHPRLLGVPAKLRASAKMPEHVRTHYLDELTRNIHRLRLAVLVDLAEWALRRRFPMLKGENVITHTLRLAAAAGEENRRPFRRLLQACARRQATREWSLAHPANQQWLRRLPQPRLETWTEGFFIEREVPDIGTVRLGPEDDLQAILRMGTDFGTCLSAGSFNSFSTAANALDANKRILYARDTQGRVWARQLVAIAESGHLVCFPIYARCHHAAMRHLFAAYDHTLAHALRVPLWRSYDQTASIAKLVCKEWCDDGIWQP